MEGLRERYPHWTLWARLPPEESVLKFAVISEVVVCVDVKQPDIVPRDVAIPLTPERSPAGWTSILVEPVPTNRSPVT